GLVTPLGSGTEYVWRRLINGACGLACISDKGSQQNMENMAWHATGFVPAGTGEGEFDQTSWHKSRSTSDEAYFAVAAAQEAFDSCGWTPATQEEKEKTGVSIGTGIGDTKGLPEMGAILKNQGYKKVGPFFVTRSLLSMSSGIVSMYFNLQGPNHAVATACAAGAHAIGDAYRMIAHGDANVMLAGGTESAITPLCMASLCKARALTTKYNDSPHEASRPFDRDRSGFVIAEGAGILVLEEHQHAVSRGAHIYAEMLGYGLSGDAHHITAPSQDGRGAYLAMSNALRDAGLSPSDIHYINAHATSTPLGDAVENRAIVRLFANDNRQHELKISSTKGAVGHLLGAAGAVEAIFTILALKKGLCPPTLNLQNFDPEEDFQRFNYVANNAQPLTTDPSTTRLVALTNSFGFGGTNACLCIGQYVE
ncbi:predicted protein, partial [Nematostella vectensis]